MIRSFLPAVLVGFACLPLRSQIQTPRFDDYSASDGLAYDHVTSILQDKKGYLWIGTTFGLSRFDGYTFQNFKYIPDMPNGLEDNRINTLGEDDQGHIWIGTEKGLYKLDPQTDQFTSFRHRPDDPSSLAHSNVEYLKIDPFGRLWVATEMGIDLLDPSGTGFLHMGPPKELVRGGLVYETLAADERNLWVGSRQNGLLRYEFDRESWSRIDEPLPEYADEPVYSLLTDRGGLWVGRGSAVFRRREGVGLEKVDLPWDIDVCRTLLMDVKGALWIGTHKGLFRVNADGTFKNFSERTSQAAGLTSQVIYDLFEDRTGLVWVATRDGLNKWIPSREAFKNIRSSDKGQNGLKSDFVYCILEDEGNIWLGTYGAGVNRFDAAGNLQTFVHDPSDPNSLADNNVNCFALGREHRLWVGTEAGLSMLDKTSGRFVNFLHQPNNEDCLAANTCLANGVITSLFVDVADDCVWIGTNWGVHRLNHVTGEINRFQHDLKDENSLPSNVIWSLLQEQDRTLWVATPRGLGRMNPDTGHVDRFSHVPGEAGSLSHDRIGTMMQARDGVIWVGTEYGLNKMIDSGGEKPTFVGYFESDGFPSNIVEGLLEDREGNIWVSHNQGITRFDPRTEVVINLDQSDGLPGNVFNSGSAFEAADGRLMFGGTNGVTIFRPEEITLSRPVWAPLLTALRVNNEVRARGAAKYMPMPLVFTHKDYMFSLDFSTMDFHAPKKTNFHFMLEGFDKQWVDAGNQRFQTYTNLDPGSYTLRVKADLGTGGYSDTTSIPIRVKPSPWLSPWAYTLYGLVVLLVLLMWQRQQRLRLVVEQAHNERLRELDRLKDEFLANTSHELRTPLNGVIGLVESLLAGVAGKMPSKARANLELVLFSSKRLTHLVNDILDFSKLKHHTLSLNMKPVDLFSMVELVLKLTRPLVGLRNLKLINQVGEVPPVLGDENRIQQIFHNLIGNAVKFTRDGAITISAVHREGMVEVSVADTGMGIDLETQGRIFDSFEQGDGSTERAHGGTGLGLAITRKLVNLHGGRIWVESTPGKGTIFTFSLPVSVHNPDVQRELLERQPTDSGFSSAARPLADWERDLLERGSRLRATPNKARILVVDDDHVNRQVLLDHLELANFAAMEAESGKRALEMVEQHGPFDMILLDVMMPHMNGYEVCLHLRKTYPIHELPILFLTARGQTEDLVAGFEVGGNDYLSKPISSVELIARVSLHLELLDTSRNLEKKVAERTSELEVRTQELETLDDIVITINAEIHLEAVLEVLLRQATVLFPCKPKALALVWQGTRQSFQVLLTLGEAGHAPREQLSWPGGLMELLRGGQRIGQSTYELNGPIANLQGGLLAMHLHAAEGQDLVLLWESDKRANFHFQGDRLNRFYHHAYTAVSKAMIHQELKRRTDNLMEGIRAAEHIQIAFLPDAEKRRQWMGEHFVIFRPKAIVSGDFYWCFTRNNQLFLALADCTGHGVQGALAAMIGYVMLNEIVREKGIDDPASVLTALHDGVRAMLPIQDRGSLAAMEVAFCCVDRKERTVVFAGAKRHMLIAHRQVDGSYDLERIKGNRQQIGGRNRRGQIPFRNHSVSLNHNDVLYLATDGFGDQHNMAGVKFGSPALRNLLCGIAPRSMEDQRRALETALAKHRGTEPQRDDITILGIRF